MSRYRLSRQALLDLSSIEDHISGVNPSAAVRVLDRLHTTFQTLADNPGCGTAADDLRPGLRYFTSRHPASNYVILFRAIDDGVAITDVIHAARDWQGLFTRGER